MAASSHSHLFSPSRTLSFSRFSSPSRSVSHPFSLSLPRPNLRPRLVCASIKKLSEVEPIPISQRSEQQLDGRIPVGAGVYGVYDSNGNLQFVGTSRCISNSIKKHKRLVPEECCSIKVGPTGMGKPERHVLRDAFNAWIGEHISLTGHIPPGNASKSDVWSAPPTRLRLGTDHLSPTESLDQVIDQLLKEHHMVAFIHGAPREASRELDTEYHASTRVLGLLVSYGFDFVTVDLLEECHSGLEECLLESFGCSTCPQVFVGGKLVGGEEVICDLVEKGMLHTLS